MLEPTRFAAEVTAFEAWLEKHTGIAVQLPMFKTMPAWQLFRAGIINSLVLVAGALVATLLFALVLGALQSSRSFLLRWPARALTIVLQSSPVVLTLVISAAVALALFPYSSAVAIGAAIVALGLMNGANAGQAIAEAMHTPADRAGRAAGAHRRAVRPRGQPLGDADRVLPRQRRQGHADRELHRRAGAPERAHRHHLLRQRPGHDLFAAARLLCLRGDRRGLAVRQAAALARAPADGDGMSRISPDFVPQLLAGMVVNFQIAAIALLIGLAVGGLLTLAKLAGGVRGAVATTLIGLMRAAPTFVVMFFLLNIIPSDATLFGVHVAPSGIMTVALSLVPYAAAYVADNGSEALRQLRDGSPLGALLFLPNVTRAFFVLVMSSSAGAAIGVPEGIAVILREAELMPTLGDKMVLFAIGILCFGVTLQAGFALMRLLQRHLGRLALRTR